jgi:ABC-type transport system substrate-binding protein
LDFIVLQGDPLMAQIEADIVADLAKVGITVNTRFLAKADFNAAMQRGDFHLCFTESWGPPYDPHSFATSWFIPKQEAHYAAMEKMESPTSRAQMKTRVTNVLSIDNLMDRQKKWTEILHEMHKQAISNPMWSRRVPAVWNNRLQGYKSGYQQYDYPMHNFNVNTGSTTITVAPGAQNGLFVTSGPMDPHSYRPNEFFISNWIYEALVHYGENGVILPALATSWTTSSISGGGQKYRFTLRSGVKFHDGTNFTCAAVKLNFDHVLQPPLTSADYHGWYHLPKHITSWTCVGEIFEVTLDAPYYPFLQELSLIRPLRMLSPESFNNGSITDPVNFNSCPAKWGTVQVTGITGTVNCAGIRSLHGTGPWKFSSSTLRGDGSISELLFTRNDDWWGEHGNVAAMKVINYADSNAVKQALLAGTLDVAVGDKVLTPLQVEEFQTQHTATHTTILGPRLLNQIIVMNAAKSPTDNIHLRKVIMHSVDKSAIVSKDLYGQASVADSLFPRDAPYCAIDLTPRWDYDLEKATLMNCPADAKQEDDNLPLILGLSLGLGIPLLIVIGVVCFCIGKRSGYDSFKDQENQSKQAQQNAPTVVGATNDDQQRV